MRYRIITAFGVLGLIGGLAAGAFIAGRLFYGTGSAGQAPLPNSGDDTSSESAVVEVTGGGAPELPADRPAVWGKVVRRDGNSLFVRTGSSSWGGGKEIEVVVARNSKIYRDVSEGEAIAQKVKPSQMDEILAGCYLTAWGERRGDRVIALVVLFRESILTP